MGSSLVARASGSLAGTLVVGFELAVDSSGAWSNVAASADEFSAGSLILGPLWVCSPSAGQVIITRVELGRTVG